MFKANLCITFLIVSLIILNFSESQAQVHTTTEDFFLPGSQPTESGVVENTSLPSDCSCHYNYEKPDPIVEPWYNWQGSMMAQAMRDPLFLATFKVATQDADSSGDLCIRCHSPRGWLSGRSSPTDGSALNDGDRQGIYCEFCHRAVKPTSIGVNPYISDDAYTDSTYSFDQTYLLTISGHIPDSSADGMYIIDSDVTRRGPYTEALTNAAPHNRRYSPFHTDAYFCGTCHDVSNPVFELQENGSYELNDLDTPSPSFDPHTMFPVERTFSEWKMSDYNSPGGVYAPQFGGNKDYVSTCQDCHMRDVTGKGCGKGNAPTRTDLPLHDMTGGNTFIPGLVASLYPTEVNSAALDSGVTRATYMLQNAATLEYDDPVFQVDSILLRVKVINETGHKLPSGYPEGRRIWLNVKAFDDEAKQNLIFESGAYNTSTGVLTHDNYLKIYEVEPGNVTEPTFHFVLNNKIHKDNRIPPRGFTNANFEAIQSPPVNYTYADNQYWDYTEYKLPLDTKYFTVKLYYQTTSKEYIEFLATEDPDGIGQEMYDLWNNNGKSAPVLMDSVGNPQPLPVELVSFTAEVMNNSVELNWQTATEINNYGFDIERSADSGKWQKIGFVEGHGNSNSPKQYSYTDKNPIDGSNFKYRLKQIDTDGKFEYSAAVNVKLVPDEFTLYQNYPNPFNPNTKIKYYIPKSSQVQIIVYDILSNEITTLVNEEKPAGNYEVQFDASNLPSGAYFYKLQAGSYTKTMKMLLLK
ncbi:T9SS type A sorting domain-containing protein [bacterium BMS3Abin03]|nr:T9SS type A sorting domain-containing protein [bacterium BMS3Abin03]